MDYSHDLSKFLGITGVDGKPITANYNGLLKKLTLAKGAVIPENMWNHLLGPLPTECDDFVSYQASGVLASRIEEFLFEDEEKEELDDILSANLIKSLTGSPILTTRNFARLLGFVDEASSEEDEKLGKFLDITGPFGFQPPLVKYKDGLLKVCSYSNFPNHLRSKLSLVSTGVENRMLVDNYKILDKDLVSKIEKYMGVASENKPECVITEIPQDYTVRKEISSDQSRSDPFADPLSKSIKILNDKIRARSEVFTLVDDFVRDKIAKAIENSEEWPVRMPLSDRDLKIASNEELNKLLDKSDLISRILVSGGRTILELKLK